MNICMSSALWCVMNGLAAAPPGIGCSIGVSTSMKPASAIWRRSDEIALVRARKVLRVSGDTIRST
ncbi:hypothetical protein D3C81_2079060 [compost metagenome]